jgi:serine/threonine protein kinase
MSNYVGHQFGSYRLIRMLGQGGFSDVYLGEHVYLKTQTAVKVLQTRLVGSSLDDFLKEALTIARLDHPNIVRVLDFGVEDTTPFLIMAYAPHGTLRQRYPNGSVVPLTAVVSYVRQIASALQYAHNERIIHRDIKPENMLLGRNDEVLLSDFGIAIIAQSTLQQDAQGVVGTVAYMAPEQIQGKPRPASDQYSLAVIVYEWLSGFRPFRGGFTELCAQHMFAPPPPLREKLPGIHPAVEQVVQKALTKDPQQRYPNIQAFADALEGASRVAVQQVSTPVGMQPTPPLQPYDPEGLTVLSQSPSLPPREALTPPSPQSNAQLPPTIVSTPPPPVPGPAYIATPSQPPVPDKKGVSRRVVLAGLGVAGLAAVGVAGYELFSHLVTPQSSLTPTPTPTPSNIGKPVSTYSGHTDWIASLAWSPDSKYIATGSNDHSVIISNALNGKFVRTYLGHTDVVSGVAWSHDGKIASGSSDRSVQVWDPVSSRLLYRYPHLLAPVRSVAWSPDGTRIAVGGNDNMVHVWKVATGEVYDYKGHTQEVHGVAWSPDGTRIASASFDGTVQVWNAADGSSRLIYNHHAQVRTVAWSPDSTFIASGGDDHKVQVWNATNGSMIFIYPNHTQFVWAITWSPDSRRIASGAADKTVQVWNALTGDNSYKYTHHRDFVVAVGWSLNEQYIASGGGNYTHAQGQPPGDTSVQVWRAL